GKEESDIYLNFENAKLSSVVNYLAAQKKINVIPRKELDTINVTLTTREALTLSRAWDVLLTLLEMNNYTIINVDNLYRIVPKAQNSKEPLPVFSSGTGTEPEDLPDNDKEIRYIYFLRNIKALTVQGILKNMLEGPVEINNDLDVCIITEKCLNIKSAMKIIKELDQGGLREAIKVITLKHSDAQDVANLLGPIIQPTPQRRNIRFIRHKSKKPSNYFSTDTRIIPESRNNSLILLGTEKNLERIINFIYKYIDVPITAAKSRLHIKEIKYAKAEKLAPLLTNIIKPPGGASKKSRVGEYKFFEDVIIATDSSQEDNKGGGNRLIIACNQDDWKRLEIFIDKLDKPQPQVAFEIIVVDVSIKTNDELWSQFKQKRPNALGIGMDAYFLTQQIPTTLNDSLKVVTNDADGKIIRTNLSFGRSVPASKNNLWGIVQAVLRKNNFSIITQPFLVTNNYQPCSLLSKETRLTNDKLADNRTGTESVQNKVHREAKTNIILTPHVNLEGIVDLKIELILESFQEVTGDNPNTDERKLNTRIKMGSGEVLVLGGLTKSILNENQYKVPILGDIPIIGNLFRSKSKIKERSNLYIFIRPSIIKPQFEGVPDEYTQLKLDYAKYQILNVDTYSKEKDPIQRWFFKPSKQSIRQKLSDARKGVFRPIDKYTYGFKQPKSVNIKCDPYFRVEEAVKKEIKKRKLKQRSFPKKTDEN
ncbi:secretin N-terminal domain-containing protein, partial [Candidatus Dependentiae bacterium]